ncbi:DrmE family protein [Planococcus ruber]|uniref:DrmE family protein n=1 Tax=Planococcus ruber TaxID=2027871 RepID=UPI001FF0677F|nr:DrmE family protein [Planococcus ruber]MCJ1909969.1 DrmE family protein [Planococcus ruber]
MEIIKPNIKNFISPSKIDIIPPYELQTITDFGRGIIESPQFNFKEFSSYENSIQLSNKLQVNNLDSFILNYVLIATKNILKSEDDKELYITVPQSSNAFSILITYQILFNDLANRLSSETSTPINFKKNEGILLVSHNIDLLQHVWNTTLRDVYLRDYFPTYIIKAKEFKFFNFNNNNKNKNQDDGTLPWLCFYRAHRKELKDLEDFKEKRPKFIVIDLIPLYHRKRASQLIKWANEISDVVIILLPANDLNLNYLTINKNNKISINQSSLQFLKKIIPLNYEKINNKSWGLTSSLKAFDFINLSFNIIEYKKIDTSLINLIDRFKKDLELCKKSNGELPLKYQRIDTLVMLMLNTILPLKEYETFKRECREFNIKDLFNKSKLIYSNGPEESSIEINLGHHLYSSFEELYSYLYDQNQSLRGMLINLQKPKFSEARTLYIVFDLFEKGLLKQQLSKNIDVVTFKEFNQMQINGDTFDYAFYVVTTPFPYRYLSGFNFSNAMVICISLFSDTTRFYKQIENVYSNKKEFNHFSNTIKDIISNSNSISKDYLKTPKIHIEKDYIFHDFDNNNVQNISELSFNMFDDIKLLELLKSNTNFELDVRDVEKIKTSNTLETMINALLIELEDIDGNLEKIFVPCEDYLKVHRVASNKIDILPLQKISENDLWIQVNQDRRKDLFNTILSLAAKTNIMKWIEQGIRIWNEILDSVWKSYYSGQRYKTHVYKKIKNAINENGGSIKGYQTISNWFNGINIVRDEKNLIALIKISNQPELLESLRIVMSSFSELKSIRIQLGRAISSMITTYSSDMLNYKEISEWVTIRADIVIPTEDIASIIKISRITSIANNNVISIPNELLYRNLNLEVIKRVYELYSHEED